MEQKNNFRRKDLFQALVNKIYLMIIMNVAFVLFCIPIVTIVPAFDSFVEIISDFDSENNSFLFYLRQFMQKTRKNFIRSYQLNIIPILLLVIFWVDLRIINALNVSSKVLLVLNILAFTLEIFLFAVYLLGYFLFKKNELQSVREFFKEIISILNYPILFLMMSATLYFSFVGLLRFPSMILFLSVSVPLFVANWLVELLLRKKRTLSEEK